MIKTIPVIDRVKQVDVAPIEILPSTDSNTVLSVFLFLYIFIDLLFLSLKYMIIS